MKWFGKINFDAARQRMVHDQLQEFPPEVVAVMGKVPRHEFVPEDKQAYAYEDRAVPIGLGQTISQPYIVAFMTSQFNRRPAHRILEIGTGSGYQAAVLAELAADVYTVEIVERLAKRAGEVLRRLGYDHVHLRIGDGSNGWPEAAPFDGIIVTCAPQNVPVPLIAQLKDDGRIVIPIGSPGDQELFVFQKCEGKLIKLAQLPVRFVPMTGANRHPHF